MRSLRTLTLLPILSTAPALAAQSDFSDHWRFGASQTEDRVIQPLVGQRPLVCEGNITFLGEGDARAAVFKPGCKPLLVEGPVSPEQLPRKKMTVEAWVAVDRAAEWGSFLGAFEHTGDLQRGWLLGYRKNRFCFALASEGGEESLTYLTADARFQLSRWYHVAGTYDGRVQRLFIDGELVAESKDQRDDVLYHTEHTMAVGAYVDSNQRFTMVGALHEVRLYNRVMPRVEIVRHMNAARADLPRPEGETFSGIALTKAKPLGELQPGINRAIDRGMEFLLSQQLRDGSWAESMPQYRNGQTSLSAYSLLKSGLPANHPAIQRAIQFLERQPPRKTYSAGCQLLFLSALDDERYKSWAQSIADQLVEWEHHAQPGGWGYPGGAVDLSNTQYAALGLWAASKQGVKIDLAVWRRLVDGTIQHHREPLRSVNRDRDGQRVEVKLAGYSYRPRAAPRGSMTVAGVSIMSLARRSAGPALGRSSLRAASQAETLGLAWLDENWSVTNSPGGGQHFYYLYGLERVGALLELELIGQHHWYREGAELLLKRQHAQGKWNNERDTCFALLFLSRATAAVQSGPTRATSIVSGESRDRDAWLRVTGKRNLTMWIPGFSEFLIEEYSSPEDPQSGLRVVRVEYLSGEELIASVPGDPSKPWNGERLAAKDTSGRVGQHKIRARVHLVPLGEHSDLARDLDVIESGEVRIDVKPDPEAWMRKQMASERQGVDLSGVEVVSSSFKDKNHDAKLTVDGLEATFWLCSPEDKCPWVRVTLPRPARASVLTLYPADSRLIESGRFDAARELEVSINGKAPLPVVVESGPLDPIEIDLGKVKRVRTLEVRITKRKPGKQAGNYGLAEIRLIQ